MFRGNKKFIYIFLALFALIVLAQYLLPTPTDWSRTYMNKNKSPFGCFAIYNLLDGTYSKKLTVNEKTLYNLNESHDTKSSLLIIDNSIEFNKNDIKALYSFLERGNTVFIAASRLSGALADSLHISTRWLMDNTGDMDSLMVKDGIKLHFTAQNLKRNSYTYPQIITNVFFSSFDSTRFNVVAYYDDGKACFIKGKVNKGTVYLMSMPDVFGNYFIANHANREVAYTMLSCLQNEQLIWDEYYKKFNITNYSVIKFVLESDPLYAAYLLMIAIIILYIIFEGRRRQRAIPLIEAPQNSTLEFVNVISHVYYNSKNHQNIAAERIRYFYESIRKKFGVDTNQPYDTFIDEIAVLSGVERKQVKQLFAYTESIRNAASITDYELAELNRQIHNFNKNSLR